MGGQQLSEGSLLPAAWGPHHSDEWGTLEAAGSNC